MQKFESLPVKKVESKPPDAIGDFLERARKQEEAVREA